MLLFKNDYFVKNFAAKVKKVFCKKLTINEKSTNERKINKK